MRTKRDTTSDGVTAPCTAAASPLQVHSSVIGSQEIAKTCIENAVEGKGDKQGAAEGVDGGSLDPGQAHPNQVSQSTCYPLVPYIASCACMC